MNTELCDNIDWVGYIDWGVRDFHGYRTERGSTYNAYLVRDDKTALIDTVKAQFVERLMSNVSELTDLSKVDYVVCNHAEPDHSGGLPSVMSVCRSAELVCDAKCQKALNMHYDTKDWKWKIVKDGDSISLGKRTLTFMETPMVHWPESMFTYIPEEKLLFSMDAFGQHYASSHRFDDEDTLDIIMHEAKTYYANIVMLFGGPIARVLDKASKMDIEIIAPSHGIIWRENIDVIMSAYQDWVTQKQARKVLVIYDTMWKSTEKMAKAILAGAMEQNIEARLIDVSNDHMTVIAAEILDAAVVAVGSPTLNKTLMPAMAAALTYLKGLGPARKKGFAFGSYGWSKGGARDVEGYLTDMKVEILREAIECQFVPTEEVLEECYEAGRMLAEKAMASE